MISYSPTEAEQRLLKEMALKLEASSEEFNRQAQILSDIASQLSEVAQSYKDNGLYDFGWQKVSDVSEEIERIVLVEIDNQSHGILVRLKEMAEFIYKASEPVDTMLSKFNYPVVDNEGLNLNDLQDE